MEREKSDKLIMELRGQVNDLLAAAQLLTPLVREQGGKREEEYLASLNQGLYRLIRTVNHMELCREDEPVFRPQVIDLPGLCRDIGRQVELMAGELNISFRWEIDREGILTLADEALLEQAILNLICNAVQAAGPGGKVTLRCKADRERCTILVKDSGPGLHFPAGEDPFLKLPGGIGLGLSAARRAAQLHGGALMLQDGEEDGVLAVLSLPIRKPDRSEGLKGPQMGYDRTGGFSPLLVELSPLLPFRCYVPEDVE